MSTASKVRAQTDRQTQRQAQRQTDRQIDTRTHAVRKHHLYRMRGR